jgi:hypothetical protein
MRKPHKHHVPALCPHLGGVAIQSSSHLFLGLVSLGKGAFLRDSPETLASDRILPHISPDFLPSFPHGKGMNLGDGDPGARNFSVFYLLLDGPLGLAVASG